MCREIGKTLRVLAIARNFDRPKLQKQTLAATAAGI
jgi:hypothetical protein